MDTHPLQPIHCALPPFFHFFKAEEASFVYAGPPLRGGCGSAVVAGLSWPISGWAGPFRVGAGRFWVGAGRFWVGAGRFSEGAEGARAARAEGVSVPGESRQGTGKWDESLRAHRLVDPGRGGNALCRCPLRRQRVAPGGVRTRDGERRRRDLDPRAFRAAPEARHRRPGSPRRELELRARTTSATLLNEHRGVSEASAEPGPPAELALRFRPEAGRRRKAAVPS